MMKLMRGWLTCLAIVLVVPVFGCAKKPREVVVYTALDRNFSEPIFAKFEAETGIKVLPKYDTESTKTIGLVNSIRAERNRPRCDVFWNNEILNTIRLKNENLLQPYKAAAAADFPDGFKDADGYWTGFAARARVLIVNTNLAPEGTGPDSVADLADPKWKGRTAIAKPLFGTTATHAACLFAALGEEGAAALFKSLRDNDVQVLSGNKTVATSVAEGRMAFGLTDTDDAIIELESGKPVKIVYPDADGPGVLFLPNTVAMVKGAPHREAAAELIEYLLSPEVELALAAAESAQIPLNPRVKAEIRVKTPAQVKPMAVNFEAAAKSFDRAAEYIAKDFLAEK